MRTGYREMLRDRTPKIISCALKFYRCKEKWLDHVYKSWIWLYPTKTLRDKAIRELLKLDKRGKAHFKFEDTISWKSLSAEEVNYWKKVCNCVSWFVKQYQYIENDYIVSKSIGRDIREIKYDIMIRYLDFMCPLEGDDAETRRRKNTDINYFVDYLIECFENS